MCLGYLWSDERKEEWLETQPDTITAYKIVRIEDGELFPPYYPEHGPYNKINQLEKTDTETHPPFRYSGRYLAHYHLFAQETQANWYQSHFCNDVKVVDCKVPKKSITTMGEQHGSVVIVAKEFEIIGEDKYFEKKEELVCV